jgi:FkbM family methyltransferase
MKKIKKLLFSYLRAIFDFLKNTKIYKIIPFRGKLFDFLFRYFWPYQSIIEIQGSKMYIDVRDKDPIMRKTFQAYALNRIHEEATTNLFKKIVKEGDVVIDLGANIGYFTLLAAKLVGSNGKVFAFEPEPKNFSYLKKNVELNNYTNVIIEQKAVSNYNGRTKLFICPYDSGHHTINRPNGIEAYRLGRPGEITSIDIEVVTLDNYLRNKTYRVDVIKIDVEGAEALVFEGMKEILSKNQNIKIFLEFFPLLIEKMGSSPENFTKYLLKNFSVYVIGHDYSMKKFNSEIMKIENYEEINYLMKEKTDHINLYLTRNLNTL